MFFGVVDDVYCMQVSNRLIVFTLSENKRIVSPRQLIILAYPRVCNEAVVAHGND